MKVKATGIQVNSDIEMGNTNKLVTSQIHSDEYGTLEDNEEEKWKRNIMKKSSSLR